MRTLELLHSGLGAFLVSAGAAVIVLVFVAGLGGLSIPWPIALLLVLGAGAIGGGIQRLLLAGSGKAIMAIHAPSGDSTAYVPTFSHIETLEIRGDLDGAARAWEEACASDPTNALVRVKAADFHLRLRKDPVAALALYRAVRALPSASRELARYAQAKIVDLYLGDLGDEGRALVELRRLIESFPGTREADEARTALARIKAARGEV